VRDVGLYIDVDSFYQLSNWIGSVAGQPCSIEPIEPRHSPICFLDCFHSSLTDPTRPAIAPLNQQCMPLFSRLFLRLANSVTDFIQLGLFGGRPTP